MSLWLVTAVVVVFSFLPKFGGLNIEISTLLDQMTESTFDISILTELQFNKSQKILF